MAIVSVLFHHAARGCKIETGKGYYEKEDFFENLDLTSEEKMLEGITSIVSSPVMRSRLASSFEAVKKFVDEIVVPILKKTRPAIEKYIQYKISDEELREVFEKTVKETHGDVWRHPALWEMVEDFLRKYNPDLDIYTYLRQYLMVMRAKPPMHHQ